MRRTWNRQAVGWNQRIKPYENDHLSPLLAACEQLEIDPETILDLGTGTGAGAMALGRRFPRARITGVDLAEAMIEMALSNTPVEVSERIHFAVGDAAALPYVDGSIDLVTQLNVPPLTEEIARVLRPGGAVIIADSIGPKTPSYVPRTALRRAFGRSGLEIIATGEAGAGVFLIGRRRVRPREAL
ncbi:MAG: class I SAM-dependent methyltransferase [Solirubrobacterales bacterium]